MADGYFQVLTGSGYISSPESDVGCPGDGGGADLRIYFDMEMLDWTISGEGDDDNHGIYGQRDTFLVDAKFGSANGAWRIQVWDSGGTKQIDVSQDSATANNFGGLSGRQYIRLDIDGSAGTVDTYYKTPDGDLTGSGYTQRGSTLTGAGTISALRNNLTNALWIGGNHYEDGSEDNTKYHRVVAYRDLTNTSLWHDTDMRTGNWADLGTGHDDAQGNTWTATGTKEKDWSYVAPTLTDATGTVEIQAIFFDNVTTNANITSAEYKVDDGSWTSLTDDTATNGWWDASLDTSTLSNGTHTITVRGTDGNSNVGDNTFDINVQNVGPVINVTIQS